LRNTEEKKKKKENEWRRKNNRTYVIVLFHSEVVAPVRDLEGSGQLLCGQERAVVGVVRGDLLR